MFIIDYENIHEKLSVGDKILVDYGGIILTVIGFESEDKYLKMKRHQTPRKQHERSEEDSVKKGANFRMGRKYSANEDEFIQEEIQELIHEENQEEEEVKDHRSSRHHTDKRDQQFPTTLPKLDSSAMTTRIHTEELDQEEAIY